MTKTANNRTSESVLHNGFASSRDICSPEWKQLVAERLSQNSDSWKKIGLGGWNQHWSRVWEFPWMFNVIRTYLKQRESLSIARILESGCGLTLVPIWLADLGGDVIGIDLDERLLSRWATASEEFTERQGSLTFVKSDMQKLDFARHDFDVAFSLSALEHTPSPYAAIQELIRVVKPGGLVAITCDVAVSGRAGLSQTELERIQIALSKATREFLPHRHIGPNAFLTLQRTRRGKLGVVRNVVKRVQNGLGIRRPNDMAVFAYAGIVV